MTERPIVETRHQRKMRLYHFHGDDPFEHNYQSTDDDDQSYYDQLYGWRV